MEKAVRSGLQTSRFWGRGFGGLDTRTRVSTPENIEFFYLLAGPFRRLTAYLTDVVVTLAAFTGLCAVIVIAVSWLSEFLFAGVSNWLADMIQQMLFGLVLVCGFLALWFYGAFMETRFNGQTVGKMMAGIRTISADGSAIDATQATLRNFFRLLDISPFVAFNLGIFGEPDFPVVIPVFSFGMICMIISPRFQRIGDLVAGTIVISEQKEWRYSNASFSDPRVAVLAETLSADWLISAELAHSLAEYVQRRRQLDQTRANEIASYLSRPLIKEFKLNPDTNPDLLLCALFYKHFGVQSPIGSVVARRDMGK